LLCGRAVGGKPAYHIVLNYSDVVEEVLARRGSGRVQEARSQLWVVLGLPGRAYSQHRTGATRPTRVDVGRLPIDPELPRRFLEYLVVKRVHDTVGKLLSLSALYRDAAGTRCWRMSPYPLGPALSRAPLGS